jgi:hypothetical protein
MASSIRMWTYILRITSMKRLNFSSSTCFYAGRGNSRRCVTLMSLGEVLPRFSSSFSELDSTSTLASAFSSSSIGSVGPIFLDFALGSAIVFPDQVITTFIFSFMGTAGWPGKSLPFGCGNVAANCAIRISNTLMKFSWFWTATMEWFILLSILSRILLVASNFLPTYKLILS